MRGYIENMGLPEAAKEVDKALGSKKDINAMARNIRTLLLGSKHTQRGTKFLIGGSHYEIYRSLQTEPKNVSKIIK